MKFRGNARQLISVGMNLGDGLLFELENGKPKLILLSYGVDKNPKKLPFRPKAATVLSSRQPSLVEEVQEERPAHQQAGRHREAKSKGEGAARSGWRNATVTLSKAHENYKGVRVAAKVKPERDTDDTKRSHWKTGQPQKSVKQSSGKDMLASRNTQSKDGMVCLTGEQLQQILNTVQTSSNGHHVPEEQRNEDSQTDSKSRSSMNERGGDKNLNDSGGLEGLKPRGGSDTSRNSVEKDQFSGCLFSWMEEQRPDSKAAIDAKKARWRRELDEQMALKQQQQQQQRPAPTMLQVSDDRDSVLSFRTSVSHREQPAAIKSSLKLGEFTPMEEVQSVEKREEQRRRWLQELDRQREEMSERRKRDKLLQSQTEDHELWASHFDSLQRRPRIQSDVPSAPAHAPSDASDRGEWEPSSSLSLVWEAVSSCGAESVRAASVDTTSGYQTRASYLRTMTALLDPAQIEERERRRLKQLEQQRAIEAQVEERRRQKEREEARRRREEDEEERRLAQERQALQRQYEMASVREKHGEQLDDASCRNGDVLQEKPEPRADTSQDDNGLEEDASPYKDMAVQTDSAPSPLLTVESLQTLSISAKHQAPTSTSKNRATKAGKENVCDQGGGDPYEAFARTDRSRRDKRRPEWNMQRPSRRFVPASERYPAALQRNREESRLKRQAELVALQERACPARREPPPQSQDPADTRTGPDRKVECVSRGQSFPAATSTERAQSPSPSALDFIPYVRTAEVFSLDPLEPATPPQQDTRTEDPAPVSASRPASSHRDPLLQPELLHNRQRQQEILRGLAQLRQGLLQKQRELESELNPVKRRDDELRTSSATRHL